MCQLEVIKTVKPDSESGSSQALNKCLEYECEKDIQLCLLFQERLLLDSNTMLHAGIFHFQAVMSLSNNVISDILKTLFPKLCL